MSGISLDIGGSQMHKAKFAGALLLALVAVVVSGVVTSAASATTFALSTEACNGTVWNLCWTETATGTPLELTGTQSVVAKKEASTSFLFTVPKVSDIVCTTVASTAGALITQSEPLVKKGVIKGSLKFSGCKLEGTTEIDTNCEIKTEETTKELEGELETGGSVLLLKPSAGNPFIEVEFKNKGTSTCPALALGLKTVTGTEQVEIVEPSTGTTVKLGNSKLVSGLKFLGKIAELTATLELEFEGLGDLVRTAEA